MFVSSDKKRKKYARNFSKMSFYDFIHGNVSITIFQWKISWGKLNIGFKRSILALTGALGLLNYIIELVAFHHTEVMLLAPTFFVLQSAAPFQKQYDMAKMFSNEIYTLHYLLLLLDI